MQNDPVNYVDLWGLCCIDLKKGLNDTDNLTQQQGEGFLGTSQETIYDSGCTLTAYVKIARKVTTSDISLDTANSIAVEKSLFTDSNILTPEDGAKLISTLIADTGLKCTYVESFSGQTTTSFGVSLNAHQSADTVLFATARIETTNADGSNTYGHTVNINSNSVIAGDITNIEKALNVKINDTSGVRSQIDNDPSGRNNTLMRIDYFEISTK